MNICTEMNIPKPMYIWHDKHVFPCACYMHTWDVHIVKHIKWASPKKCENEHLNQSEHPKKNEHTKNMIECTKWTSQKKWTSEEMNISKKRTSQYTCTYYMSLQYVHHNLSQPVVLFSSHECLRRLLRGVTKIGCRCVKFFRSHAKGHPKTRYVHLGCTYNIECSYHMCILYVHIICSQYLMSCLMV